MCYNVSRETQSLSVCVSCAILELEFEVDLVSLRRELYDGMKRSRADTMGRRSLVTTLGKALALARKLN